MMNLDDNDLIISCFTDLIASSTVHFGWTKTLDDITPLKCVVPSDSKYSTQSDTVASWNENKIIIRGNIKINKLTYTISKHGNLHGF